MIQIERMPESFQQVVLLIAVITLLASCDTHRPAQTQGLGNDLLKIEEYPLKSLECEADPEKGHG